MTKPKTVYHDTPEAHRIKDVLLDGVEQKMVHAFNIEEGWVWKVHPARMIDRKTGEERLITVNGKVEVTYSEEE